MKKTMLSTTLLAGLISSVGEASPLNTNALDRASSPSPFSWEGFYAGVIGGGGGISNAGTLLRDRPTPNITSISPNVTVVTPGLTHDVTITSVSFTNTITLTTTIIDPDGTVVVPGITEIIPGLAIPDNVDFSSNDEGWFIGGELGYDAQYGPLLIGAVADLSGTQMQTRYHNEATSIVADLNWFATTRARLGVPFNRFLVYGAGGLAWGNFDITASEPYGGPFAGRFSKFGWAAGGGVAYALKEHWTLDVSYIHLDFGTAVLFNTSLSTLTSDLSADLGRVGLSYKFYT